MEPGSSAALAVPPSRIWNLCMLAHVDHGKSALSDALISANGIISSRSAGKTRYMDSREDEQRRGITMKSSSIALGHRSAENEPLKVVNLVDSPGHVDFSGEVEAALRICDGALLVVDVVEGVCVQTVTVLRAALEQAVRPVLVLNKIDRLFAELHLDPTEAYQHIVNTLAQVNVIMGVREVEEMMAAASVRDSVVDLDSEWTLEDKASDLRNAAVSGFFSPELGNVVFASALDGWAFRIVDFARIFSKKFGISEKVLTRTLWGDYFLQPKSKKIVRKKVTDLKSASKPMFVQFIMSNIHSIYDTILSTQHDLDMAVSKRQNIVSKLGLKVTARDLKHRDVSTALRAIMNAWLPAASCLMQTVVEKLPSAALAQADLCRTGILWPHLTWVTKETGAGKSAANQELEKSVRCQYDSIRNASVENSPFIAIVSKMVEGDDGNSTSGSKMNIRTPKSREELDAQKEVAKSFKSMARYAESTVPMIAFARILSGTLSEGDAVYVYSPKYHVAGDGSFDPACVSKATVTELFLLMGRGKDQLKSASAGAIVGIAGLDDVILKTATISTEPPGFCLPAGSVSSSTLGSGKDAVVNVAVEPHLPKDMGKLRDGLRRLNQADPAVETFISAKGEHVIAAHGELHLERCLNDLQERFAKGIRIHVSKPIVSFRETVWGGVSTNVEIPVDSVSANLPNPQSIDLETEGKHMRGDKGGESARDDPIESGKESSHVSWGVHVDSKVDAIPNFDSHFLKHGRCIRVGDNNTSFIITAAQIPPTIANALEEAARVLRRLEVESAAGKNIYSPLNHQIRDAVESFAKESESRKTSADAIRTYWIDKIFRHAWSAGPQNFGANLLIGPYKSSTRSEKLDAAFGQSDSSERSSRQTRKDLENAIIAGFQLGTRAGPLCEEPLHGVIFFVDLLQAGDVVENLELEDQGEKAQLAAEAQSTDGVPSTPVPPRSSNTPSNISGLVIGSTKEALRLSVMHGNPRLMEGILHVDISVPGDALGKAYTVLGQRRGRVLNEDMKEGLSVFRIEALLPVQDSFGFTDVLRKQTSGFAVPQMVFSHWEAIELDPFWYPQTAEELEDLGASDMTLENNNLARKLINGVRRRKGLKVEEKIVEDAEKQRTLSRKK